MQLKLGRLRVNLATKPAPKTDQEVGSVGNQTVTSLFDGEVINTSKIKTKDLTQMRQNDGTAKALYNILTMPILSADWEIEPADDSAEAKAQAEFIKDCLTLPPYRGGMSTGFDLVLADALRAVLEGWRLFEKVYTIRDGKIVYSKIATRDNTTVTLRQDGRGGFDGASQYAYIDGTFKRVLIDRDKCFLFTYGKEFDNLYGESAFLPAYYHYDKKHRLYYGAHQAVQYGAIPPKIVKGKAGATQTALDEVVDSVDQLGFNSTVGLPDGYEVNPYEASKGRIDPQPLIDHHNAEMARSILAQFMMLGTGSNTGSWALSSDQSDMFVMSLESVMRSLEQHINTYLIAELHDYNFETPLYSKFEFQSIQDSTLALLKDTALKIFDKRPEGIPDYLIQEAADKLATHLGIDVPKDNSKKTPPPATPPATPPVNQSREQHFLANGAWRRDLTPAENKVNFSAISKKMDTLESQFQDAVKPVYDNLRADTVKRLTKILNSKDYKALNSFSLNYGADLAKIIANQMLDAYTYAKVGAADEIGVPAPATKAASKTLIKQQAQAISDKQLSDLTFQIKNIVTEAQRKNQLAKIDLSVGDVLASVGTAITSFYDEKILPTASVAIAKGVNIGRSDVFDQYQSKISLYQYSAILDKVTCPICEELDGTVLDYAEYLSTPWQPPIHFGCRCIWVEILSDETNQPDITGVPDSPGGVDAPLLNRNKNNSDEHDVELVEKTISQMLDRMLSEASSDGQE